MEERERELKVGSQDDMLAHAEQINEKALTLKSLEKHVNTKFAEFEEKIKVLERRIEILKKSVR